MLTAFHAKCRGSRRLQSGERSWLDSRTRHAYTRKNVYAAAPCTRRTTAHRDANKTGLVLRAYIYPLDSRRRGDQEGRARKTISGLRHCAAGGQRQSSRPRQRADSSSILNPADQVPALRFRALRAIPFPRKITLAADVCFFFPSHNISKGKLKSQMCTNELKLRFSIDLSGERCALTRSSHRNGFLGNCAYLSRSIINRVNIYEHKFETFQLIALCDCIGFIVRERYRLSVIIDCRTV